MSKDKYGSALEQLQIELVMLYRLFSKDLRILRATVELALAWSSAQIRRADISRQDLMGDLLDPAVNRTRQHAASACSASRRRAGYLVRWASEGECRDVPHR